MLTVRSIITTVALAGAITACTEEPATQVLTGRIATTQGAVAIRAVSDGDVVTAGRVRSDGSFTLVLPAGSRYRLEVMTSAGVKNVVSRSGAGLKDLVFKVCTPTAPFDVGGIGGISEPGEPGCLADGTCPPPCDPSTDPYCEPPPPPPCGPNDPSCAPCDPTDPATACPPPPPPPCGPNDPSCTPCDPTTDPSCPCDSNGSCGGGGGCTDPSAPGCLPPGCDSDGNCTSPCGDPTDPGCAPPCDNPLDPASCLDPCMDDPMTCGCSSNDPGCWPVPGPCACDSSGMCEPGGAMMPDHLPVDFGCE